jgi:putative sigma-54 modulation protein
MNIEFVGRHVQLDERIRSQAEAKLARVAKFLREPIEVHVTLETEKFRQIAELTVTHRHGRLHTREEQHDLLDALAVAVETLEKQALRTRKRAVDRRRRANRAVATESQWPLEVLSRESLREGGDGPRVIKSSQLQIKPMTLEEAALALEESRHEFVVFRDADSDRVNVLYKRRDEDYGLITTES